MTAERGLPRNLLGYAGTWPDITWPNGRRLAVSVVINFEEGAEEQVGDGDPRSERIGEVHSVVEPGTRDPGQEQIFGYGTRAGFWRLRECLLQNDVPATIFFCGRAVARVPELARLLCDDGHEPAIHGWLWRPHADFASTAEEAASLDACQAELLAATGQRAVGFFCRGAESPFTRALLSERGYVYTSNGFDDDLPYYSDGVDSRGLLVVPYALDSNDMKFFHPNGFVRAREMADYVIDALDVLEDEARRGRARLLNIGFHLRIVGRPGRFKAFQMILEELNRRRDRIWLARRIDIARAFLAAVPRP